MFLVMRCVGAAALTLCMALFAPSETRAEDAFSWTGFYAGLNAGWAHTSADAVLNATAGPFLHPNAAAVFSSIGTGAADDDTFIAGGQIGYNQQIGGIVVGLEADLAGLSSDDNERHFSGLADLDGGPVQPVTLNDSIETDFLATIRGRIGLSLGRTLLYGTGGIAFTRVNFDRELFVPCDNFLVCPANPPQTPPVHSGSGSEFITGWTAGGGVEHAVLNNMTIKVEYLFSQFNDEVTFVTQNASPIAQQFGVVQLLEQSAKLDSIQTLRVGINAKF